MTIGEDYIEISRVGDNLHESHAFDPRVDKSCIESDYSDSEAVDSCDEDANAKPGVNRSFLKGCYVTPEQEADLEY